MADKVDTKLTSVDKNDKNTSIKRPERIVDPQAVVTTQQPENTATTISSVSSFHTQEVTNRSKVEDKPIKSSGDINKKITPLNSVSNNMQHTVRNESAPLGRSKPNGHEEPFSPDGFTQFEKVCI